MYIRCCTFAAIGFVTYNGMTAEKFLYAYIKSEFLIPKNLTFKPVNFYYELLKDKLEKEGENSEDIKNTIQTR